MHVDVNVTFDARSAGGDRATLPWTVLLACRWTFRIVLGSCELGLIGSSAAMAGQADLILLGGKVVTAEAKQPTAEAIAVAGERIRGVGTNDDIRRLAGPTTRVVDLRGRTVIPGLMDTHVHLLTRPEIVDEPSLRNFERTALPQVMAGFVSHGITTIRSTGDALPYIAELRGRLERRELIGPRLLITGPALGAPGGHPATTVFRSNPFLRRLGGGELENEAHARQVVRQIARARVDAVKIIVDDIIVNVPPLSDAVVATIIAEAHRAGLRAIAHVSVTNAIATAKRLIEMGLDEFVHPPLIQGDDILGSVGVSELAAMLARRGIPVTTTLSVADAFRDAAGGERAITGGLYTAASRQRFERQLNVVRGFSESRVKLIVGTDWPSRSSSLGDPRLLPGATTLHELELLRRAGLSTPAILTAATRHAAEALGIIDKVGTLADGKLADLVVLDGDLLQDFSALHRRVAVLKEGRIVHGALPER